MKPASFVAKDLKVPVCMCMPFFKHVARSNDCAWRHVERMGRLEEGCGPGKVWFAQSV